MKIINTYACSIVLILFGWSNSTFSQSDSIIHNSVYRNYLVHLPPSYSSSTAYPLVINMHGFGSDASQQQLYSRMDAVADTANFIVVYPYGHGDTTLSWNSGQLWSYTPGMNDVTFISALIDTMAMNFSIDTTKVYACGMSNGGFMSYRLACELEDKIAAIASVTGVMADSIYNSCQTDRPVPVMHIHGTTDPTVNYNGDFGNTGVEVGIEWWVTNNNCPSTPIITSLPDVDGTDGTTVATYYYGPCDNDSEVLLYKVDNGGHTWPGAFALPVVYYGLTNQDIDGSGEAWTFFRRHQMTSIQNPVSHKEVDPERKVNIWPNPSSGIVHIDGVRMSSVVSIVTMLGQEVKLPIHNDVTKGQVNLETGGLTPGVYLIKVSGLDFSFTQILVKQ